MRKKISKIWDIPEGEFRIKLKKSKNMADFQRSIGSNPRGGNFYTVKQRISEMGLSTEHWTFRVESSIMARSLSKEDFIKNWLVPNRYRNTVNLKKYLLKFEFVTNECSICKNKGSWENLPLTLQLDHINGDSKNNELSNLRLLCPNCHSQTSTFCRGVNVEMPSKEYLQKLIYEKSLSEISKKVGLSIEKIKQLIDYWELEYSKNMTQKGKKRPALKLKLETERGCKSPSKEVLEKEVWEKPASLLAKKYKVSDRCICNWCKSYNISKPPRGYWRKIESGMSHEEALIPKNKKVSTCNRRKVLSDDLVRKIREKLFIDKIKPLDLAKEYDLSEYTVYSIRSGKIYQNVR